MEHIFNGDDLYCYYTYYILLEYFDNIVYNSMIKIILLHKKIYIIYKN